MSKKFKQGQVVISGGNTAVLVTGKGEAGCPSFAGVVVMEIPSDEDIAWGVGYYSKTWATDAFKKTGIDISKNIQHSTTRATQEK